MKQRKDLMMEDPRDSTREDPSIPPEAVGQDRPTEEEDRSGFPGFIGMNLRVWGAVLVILLIAIAVLVIIAIT